MKPRHLPIFHWHAKQLIDENKDIKGEFKMAKTTAKKKKTVSKRAIDNKVASQNVPQAMAEEPRKNAFEEKFGEGTAFDLDYGKLLIIGLCVYIAIQVS